ncbi:MAG: response regulator [Deltaproteobacteria bacterium]|nr:MAG: response regulator [Deltaproteobacteria bacterium]
MPAGSRDRAVGNYYQEQTIIAIVDDDESVCHAIKGLVRSLGMEADTFASGQEFIGFIEAMPSRRFNCVILDVQMPGLNGLDVQERLKRLGNRFPIIFLTAHDEVSVRERALAAGAVAFLRKPFAAELLIKTLRAAVKLDANA